jgi:hypothetical protein
MPHPDLNPYAFGYAVGAYTSKKASWGDVAQGASDMIIGGNPLDPTQRGLAADLALYSNPFTGVATAASDTAQHLWNGRLGSAAGSILMGGLSFAPGLGAAVGKGITGAVRTGAKAIGNPALQRGAAAARNFVTTGSKGFTQAQNAVSSTIQKAIPQKTTAMTLKAPIRSTVDAAVRNPLRVSADLMHSGGAGIHSAAPEAAAASVAPSVTSQLPMTPPPLPMPALPTGSFRPQPLVNFAT